jgi:DNA-directed RNA polymerase specialized sigma24 family protein
MQAQMNRATTAPGGAPPELVRAAFRDLHATRLHGFALLVTLGDRARAARLTDEALVGGAAQIGELRHPERAAAWLRKRVLRNADHFRRPGGTRVAAERRLALEPLGVGPAAFAGLAALSIRERALLVADSVERLDTRDVATILGIDGPRLDRLIRRARLAYSAAAVDAADDLLADGPTVERVRAVSARALT